MMSTIVCVVQSLSLQQSTTLSASPNVGARIVISPCASDISAL